MMDDKTVPNQTRDLSFADDFIFAKLVEDVHDYPVEDAVVVNVSPSAMITGDEHPAIVPAWKSTWLKGGQIKSAERAALLKVRKATNLGGCIFRGWDWLGNRIKSFPRDTPLFISPQDEIGTVSTDPLVFTNERAAPGTPQTFTLKLNLWWSPGDTDCFIHNEHRFLETHTQIHGSGRMQKFRLRDETTIYEDVVMPVGYSHDPFCRVSGKNEWAYPWHRYYADTDSVWLAIELHP
ncbi:MULTISPECIES: hypothetical protein [unclassified Mesorhizobium]|uniref:hypothetical protein n=1 Tax=unclassified Mesorhizobium TaxID=325217 RepID=UPI001FE02221|nr:MULTISPECIES: hypothetical protein [unclassified Mesorhizobium]WIE90467.1 hypothetical protein P9270_023410 [Mesorhizobium sp. WSM4875]MCT2578796.1 hypothetical protein [Mesorhizobium sp. P13.3]MDF3167735.1 hypothetical protein [Mesorhizobium sp. P16.1]MDF3178380.1 hypothetical protein [Mesorhizobium sp. P17.1]MDF3184648.1 hypothetical protein [Mesorhizobium sp. ICCV3110.1]